MKLLFAVTTLLLAVSSPLAAQDIQIVGMYRLISEERTIVPTGEVIPTKGATGYISYTADGRMLVLIVREPRPKPEQGREPHRSTAR
jgi:hypothetical protein